MGTVVADPPEHSAAFVVDERAGSGEALGYSLGHAIRGAEIVAIDTLQVTVERSDGTREILVAEPWGGVL